MKNQSKSIDKYAANEIRVRMFVRVFENKINLQKPPKSERYDRYAHISEASGDIFGERVFKNWLKGEKLPNATTCTNMDNAVGEDLSHTYIKRSCNSVIQTFFCALDLISQKATPFDKGQAVAEAEEILQNIYRSTSTLITTVPNLNNPKMTSYQPLRTPSKKLAQPCQRVNDFSRPMPVAYPYIADRLNPYDLTSSFSALLLYAVKPNNLSKHSKDNRLMLVLDIISAAIAGYIVMLHRNPIELSTGGPAIDHYRLIYQHFLFPETTNEQPQSLINEVFNNEYPEFKGWKNKKVKEAVLEFKEDYYKFISLAELSELEINKIIQPINPEKPIKISIWWGNL